MQVCLRILIVEVHLKGYLIDSAQRTISELDYEYTGRNGIAKIAGYGRSGFCMGWRWPEGDVLYVDDEGLLKPQEYFFKVNARPDGQPYGGNGFVTGADSIEDTDPPSLSIGDVLAQITWLTRDDYVAWVKARESDGAIVFHTADESRVVSTWGDILRQGDRA